MGLRVKRIVPVEETDEGFYRWQLPDGSFLNDGNGRFFGINGLEHDVKKMKMMQEEAAALGFPDGKVVWSRGMHSVTDNEYDDQMERFLDGKVPDWNDPSIVEDYIDRENRKWTNDGA